MANEPIFAFHLQDLLQSPRDNNNLNTKFVFLEELLKHEEVGIMRRQTQSMQIHQKNLNLCMERIGNRIKNNIANPKVWCYINQYVDDDPQEINLIMNDVVKLNTKKDLLLMAVATPYRYCYYYTSNQISVPPSEFIIESMESNFRMNMSTLQAKFCTGTSGNDKLAFLRHAIVVYYTLDATKVYQRQLDVEDTKEDDEVENVEVTKRMDIKSRERIKLAEIKAEIFDHYLHTKQGKSINGNQESKILQQALNSIEVDEPPTLPPTPPAAPMEPSAATLDDIKQFDIIEVDNKQFLVVEYHNENIIATMDGVEYKVEIDGKTMKASEIVPITWDSFQMSYGEAVTYENFKILNEGLQEDFDIDKIEDFQGSHVQIDDKLQELPTTVFEWLEHRNTLFIGAENVPKDITTENFELILRIGNLRFDTKGNFMFKETKGNGSHEFFYCKDSTTEINASRQLKDIIISYIKQQQFTAMNSLRKVVDCVGNKSKILQVLFKDLLDKEIIKFMNARDEQKKRTEIGSKVNDFLEENRGALYPLSKRLDMPRTKIFFWNVFADSYDIDRKLLKPLHNADYKPPIHETYEDSDDYGKITFNEYIDDRKPILRQKVADFLYDEREFLVKCSEGMEDADANLDSTIETLTRQFQDMQEQLETIRRQREEQSAAEEAALREQEEKEMEEKKIEIAEKEVEKDLLSRHNGLATFLFNEFGKVSVDNLKRAFVEYLELGLKMAEAGQVQDFYGETYADFFEHMRDRRRTYKLFNQRVRYSYETNNRSYDRDYKIFKQVVENIETLTAVTDLKNLDAKQPYANWNTIVRFALYEKYNYLLPALHKHLGDLEWKTLMKDNRALDDFVYVFCTMYTLIFQSNLNFV